MRQLKSQRKYKGGRIKTRARAPLSRLYQGCIKAVTRYPNKDNLASFHADNLAEIAALFHVAQIYRAGVVYAWGTSVLRDTAARLF